MAPNLIAQASTTIHADSDDVWKALIDPAALKQYMFGADVSSDWRAGSLITWKGEIKGKRYEDKGRVLEVESGRLLKYSHFSPLSGQPDKPENYHTVTIELEDQGDETLVSLSQDKNADEKAREHSEKNWGVMLEGLKKYVEKE